MLGKTLRGRYEIIDRLGNGGFGQTYLAIDRDLPGSPRCVVKHLKPLTNNSDILATARRLFEREAQVLYQLGNSDFIPRLLAHFEEAGEFYLVQELVEGSDLRAEFVPGKKWQLAKVIEFLEEVLSILNFIHQQDVIHRDLKPSNLMRREKDQKLVLIDFGAVKQITTRTLDQQNEAHLNTGIGTPGYAPPEQLCGNPMPASDIYAAGMMGIQALTGILPHQLPEDPQTKEKLWRKFLSQPQSQVNSLLNILEKMVRYDGQERYQNVTEVLQALDNLEKASTTVLKPLMIPEKPLPSNFRNEVSKQVSREDYRHRQILINKVKNFWIKGVLESSLHGKAMLELGLESRLDLVARPWSIIWETATTAGQLLPLGVRVSDKFQELGVGRSLLVLGEPGSGKTTTLLQLARDLLEAAQQNLDQPIPVIFNLSSWKKPAQKMANWLINELKVQYQVSSDIARHWIEAGELLLLLDGLDEVQPKLQEICITAINQFCQEYGTTELVVCSRIQDYQLLQNRLALQGAICLQPLTFEQVKIYLETAGSELTGLKFALQKDEALREFARSPLMLSIMTLAYQGVSDLELLSVQGIQAKNRHLFDAYIQRMFAHRSTHFPYSKQQTIYWLGWLARHLSKQSQTVFFIEQIQPSWLSSRWLRLIYKWSLALTFISLACLFSFLMLPKTQIPLALIFGAFLFWLVCGIDRIQPVTTLKWSWQKAGYHILLGVLIVSPLFFIFKILYHSFLQFFDHQIVTVYIPSFDSLFRGFLFGLSLGVVYGVIQGFKGAAVEQKSFPNQGMIQSAKNSLVFATIGFCVLGLSAKVIQWNPNIWVMAGLLFGLTAGGGEACLKHVFLRIILCWSGKIPWNYAQFLDAAVSKVFMQKVGGGYIFIHRLLLEYFAQIYSEKSF